MCSGSTPFCNTGGGTCRGCNGDQECADLNAGIDLCNTAAHQCVECLTADDCAANDTQCSQATGAAVPADAVVAEDAGAPATPSDAVALPADAGAPGAEDTADDEALPADADASPGAREE